MANPDPAGDVVDHLRDAVAVLSRDTNLFRGKVREVGPGVPSEAVFVLYTGGADPSATLGLKAEIYRPSLQVRVRSQARVFSSGEKLAIEVREALHHQSFGGYVDAMASEPIYIEEDEAGRHHWSVNVELMIKRDRR